MTRHSQLSSSSSDDGSDWSSSDDDDEPAPPPAQKAAGLGAWILLMLGVCAVVGTALLVVFLQRKDGGGTAVASATLVPTQEAAATAPAMLSTNSPDAYESPPIIDQGDEGDEGQDEATTTRNRHTSSPTSGPSKSTGAASTNSSSSSGSGNLPPLIGIQLLVDFSTYTPSSSVSSFLTSHALEISTDPIGSTPISHTFLASNVDIVDGALRLKVTGQSGRGDIKSAEVSTKEKGILYGRVTTRAKASPVPGVCHGFFFYTSDQLEVDIELLSSYFTQGRGDSVKPGLQMTNQALTKGGKSSNVVVPYPSDPTGAFHDYTIEWTKFATIFFFDGKEVGRLTTNVPPSPMAFIWNNWSSGEPNWSAGPPTEDSYLLISAVAGNWTTG